MKKIILNHKSYLKYNDVIKYKMEIENIDSNYDIVIFPQLMYLSLFNSITDALEEPDIEKMKQILTQAQIDTEDMYIESNEE